MCKLHLIILLLLLLSRLFIDSNIFNKIFFYSCFSFLSLLQNKHPIFSPRNYSHPSIYCPFLYSGRVQNEVMAESSRITRVPPEVSRSTTSLNRSLSIRCNKRNSYNGSSHQSTIQHSQCKYFLKSNTVNVSTSYNPTQSM